MLMIFDGLERGNCGYQKRQTASTMPDKSQSSAKSTVSHAFLLPPPSRTCQHGSTWRGCHVGDLRRWRGAECERARLSSGQRNGFLFGYALALVIAAALWSPGLS